MPIPASSWSQAEPHESLFGYIEYRQAGDVLETDFSMIRPGSLHRAKMRRADAGAETHVEPGPALKAALLGPSDRARQPPAPGHDPDRRRNPSPSESRTDVRAVLRRRRLGISSPSRYDPDFRPTSASRPIRCRHGGLVLLRTPIAGLGQGVQGLRRSGPRGAATSCRRAWRRDGPATPRPCACSGSRTPREAAHLAPPRGGSLRTSQRRPAEPHVPATLASKTGCTSRSPTAQ